MPVVLTERQHPLGERVERVQVVGSERLAPED